MLQFELFNGIFVQLPRSRAFSLIFLLFFFTGQFFISLSQKPIIDEWLLAYAVVVKVVFVGQGVAQWVIFPFYLVKQ